MMRFFRAPRGRTILGLSLAALFVPVLIGITACIDTPIGDPEQGWVDPRISGVWLAGEPAPADYEATLWLFEPYDSRTWLVTFLEFSGPGEDEDEGATEAADSAGTDAGSAAPPHPDEVLRLLGTLAEPRAEPSGTSLFKAWLTSIGDRRFLVLEPKLVLDSEGGFTPSTWVVLHIVVQGDRMKLAIAEAEGLYEATTRGEAEQAIARSLADPDAYGEPLLLYRIPLTAYQAVADAVGRTGLMTAP